jgi:hypothetical protein
VVKVGSDQPGCRVRDKVFAGKAPGGHIVGA